MTLFNKILRVYTELDQKGAFNIRGERFEIEYKGIKSKDLYLFSNTRFISKEPSLILGKEDFENKLKFRIALVVYKLVDDTKLAKKLIYMFKDIVKHNILFNGILLRIHNSRMDLNVYSSRKIQLYKFLRDRESGKLLDIIVETDDLTYKGVTAHLVGLYKRLYR